MCTLMNSAQSQLMVKKKDPEKGGFASNVIKVGNKEIFASDFSEKDVVTGKNGEKSIDNPANNKLLLKNLVQYEKIDGVKHGMCLLCGKDNKGNFLTSIPMKNSNTSGVKSHFQRHHKGEYAKIFPSKIFKKKIPGQSTLDSFSNVNESSSYAENDPEDSDEDTDNSELTTYSVANLVKKIRKLHCKIRNSEVLCQKLENCCTAFDIKYKKPISDTKTRWNSTFDMLHTAASLKEALDRMCKKNDALKIYTIKASEWILLKELLDLLKDFKRVPEKISGEQYVTLNTTVIAFNCLLDKLEKISFDLDGKTYRSEIDEKLIEAFQEGRNKLVKHYQKFNWLYCVSLILDPRIKISGSDETSWGQEMKHNALKKFKSIYKNYYDRFSTTDCEEPVPKKLKIDEEDSLDFDILFVKPSTSSISEKELNNYLESPRPEPDINILIWWKTYANVYPIIARIARDVLCIPATSVISTRRKTILGSFISFD
ncbi:hypothetical protein TKK_0002237 [Trichogramma kaykai]